jgi:hypothetical protein
MQPKDNLLLLGDSPSLYYDLAEFENLNIKIYDVMVVNVAGVKFLDDIQHWVTCHPQFFKEPEPIYGYIAYGFWERERKNYNGNTDYVRHTSVKLNGHYDCLWSFDGLGGGSGLLAVRIALELGYRKIIIGGISLTDGYFLYREDFIINKSLMDGKVKALSGFLQELLGRPENEWLEK